MKFLRATERQDRHYRVGRHRVGKDLHIEQVYLCLSALPDNPGRYHAPIIEERSTLNSAWSFYSALFRHGQSDFLFSPYYRRDNNLLIIIIIIIVIFFFFFYYFSSYSSPLPSLSRNLITMMRKLISRLRLIPNIKKWAFMHMDKKRYL